METHGSIIFKEQFADSPQLLALLESKFAGPENTAARECFFKAVDESAFALRPWAMALQTVQVWLDARGLELPIKDQIGYVSCADESAGAGANLTHLPALVEEMLDHYGCERAAKKSG